LFGETEVDHEMPVALVDTKTETRTIYFPYKHFTAIPTV